MITGRVLLVSSLAALAGCAVASTPAPMASAIIPAPAAPIAKPADESLTIAFDQGGSKLSSTAMEQLDMAARLYRDARPEVMIVAGHSDRSGPEYVNLILSARRASQVKQALVDRGVPGDRLQVVAIGQAEPVPGIEPSRSAVVTWR